MEEPKECLREFLDERTDETDSLAAPACCSLLLYEKTAADEQGLFYCRLYTGLPLKRCMLPQAGHAQICNTH